MEKYEYRPTGVCSRQIFLELDGDKIVNVSFLGGCSGNLQGISSLVKGMKITDAIDRLKGIDCGGRGTSCPDQLSMALQAAVDSRK